MIHTDMEDKREYNIRLSNYINKLSARANKDKLKEFAELRDFKLETVREAGIFYIGEMAEMLLPEYLDDLEEFGVISATNYKPIFRNRWAIPIKNTDGLVENLVGYSPSADERYIYGTGKYYMRRETMYGLENLDIAYDLGYAIVTEGITDTIRIRDLGFKNCFAMCGTHSSDRILKQLNRCRYGVIKIPDRDDAGLRALRGWETFRSMTLMVNMQYKDIDEMCRNDEDNKNLVRQYINDIISWIKTDEHCGVKGIQEIVTII